MQIFASTEDIRYIYDGNGTKLASVVGGSSTYYRGVMVYGSAAGTAEQLVYMLQPEGLIAHSSGDYIYKYFKTDHMGSTRCVLAVIRGELIEEQTTDYYPFGMAWETNDLHTNRYLYSGKELQDASIGGKILGLYDFGARYYDPILCRWFNVDPALQTTNPYLYCSNNPVMYADPNGEFFFSLLCAIIPGAQFLMPAGTGLDMSIMQGGMRAKMQGDTFWSGAWKGGITGLATVGLSMIGGPGMSFGANVGLGFAQGSAIGMLDAAIWKTNIWEGALKGGMSAAVLTAVTSENLSNLLNGEGFRNNSNVFDRMIGRGMDKQGIVDYFGFEGIYNPEVSSKEYQSGKGNYWGNVAHDGTINYGNFAFDNYATLKGTYIKESYHSMQITRGKGWAQMPEDIRKFTKMDLEEINGYTYAMKREGLFHGHKFPLMGGYNHFADNLDVWKVPYTPFPKRFKWLYKIPRRW